jgi:L-aminopeptidase/D-esterase-like protein
MGQAACTDAFAGTAFKSGNYGAGCGAVVGKARGASFAMKGGIGCAAFQCNELKVGVIVAVNCVGDIYENGKIIAGARLDSKNTSSGEVFAQSESIVLQNYRSPEDFFSAMDGNGTTNTIIACVITNARLDKCGATRLASLTHNGIARAIRPAHTIFDGDTIFTLCNGSVDASVDAVGVLACAAMESAIADAVKSARSLHGFPSVHDIL